MHRLELKHLRAVVALAEERHFSRAAARLHIGQSGLTKQVAGTENFLGFPLFVRETRSVTLTAAGEIFAAQARIALQYLDRAINLSRASGSPADLTIHVGRSPYVNPYLISQLLSLRLPLFPQLRISLTSKLPGDLKNDLLEGSIDLAFLTTFPDTPRLSGSVVADESLWIAMLEDDPLAGRREVEPSNLASRSCILLERHVQPYFYDELIRTVQPASTEGCTLHHVMTAEDSLQLILRGFGLAVLAPFSAWRILHSGVTIRPLKLDALRLKTRLVARSDNDSKLLGDVVRGFVKSLWRPSEQQFHLPLSNG